MPNPCDSDFYVRYVEICRQVGVEPNSPQRVRELVGEWNRKFAGDANKSPDASALRASFDPTDLPPLALPARRS